MKEKEQPHHLTREAAEPTVIHHEDETLLAQWLKKGLERGAGFWLSLVGTVAAFVAVLWLLNSWLNRTPPGATAWTELMTGATPASEAAEGKYEGMPTPVRPLLRIADENPDTPAARWARIQAAGELYRIGLDDLPNQKQSGRPMLASAIEQFDLVLKSAPAGSPEALLATLGKARAQESRGELELARASYEAVAKGWPSTPQAEAASKRAAELATPEAVAFYKDFYTKSFDTLESPGATAPGLPALPPGLGSPGGIPAGDIPGLGPLPGNVLDLPPASTTTVPAADLPPNVFAPTEGVTPPPAAPDAATADPAPAGAPAATPPATPAPATAPAEGATPPPAAAPGQP